MRPRGAGEGLQGVAGAAGGRRTVMTGVKRNGLLADGRTSRRLRSLTREALEVKIYTRRRQVCGLGSAEKATDQTCSSRSVYWSSAAACATCESGCVLDIHCCSLCTANVTRVKANMFNCTSAVLQVHV